MTVMIGIYGGDQAQMLHTARIGALVFTALFLAAALAEFFLFDIPDIFALESGMAVRKWLRQIEGSGKEAKREAFVIERDIMVVHTDERTDG